jgi:hypothetical protein
MVKVKEKVEHTRAGQDFPADYALPPFLFFPFDKKG